MLSIGDDNVSADLWGLNELHADTTSACGKSNYLIAIAQEMC